MSWNEFNIDNEWDCDSVNSDNYQYGDTPKTDNSDACSRVSNNDDEFLTKEEKQKKEEQIKNMEQHNKLIRFIFNNINVNKTNVKKNNVKKTNVKKTIKKNSRDKKLS